MKNLTEKGRVFFDLDGTGAVFNIGVKMENLYEKSYFFNLAPLSSVTTIRMMAKSRPEKIYILSSYLEDSDYAYAEKIAWVRKHIPELPESHILLVPSDFSKRDYVKFYLGEVSKSDILVDDYTKNLRDWEEEGTSVKFYNGINGKKGSKHKNSISESDNPILNAFRLGLLLSEKGGL